MPNNNKGDPSNGSSTPNPANKSSLAKRRKFYAQDENSVSRIVQVLKKRIFTANHLMVQSFKMHPLFLYIIFAMEYMQACYFALNKIQIYNNFSDPHDSHRLLDQTQANDFHAQSLNADDILQQNAQFSETITSNLNSSESQYSNSVLAFSSNMNILRYLNYQYIIIEAEGPNAFRNYQIALYLHLSYFVLLFVVLLQVGNRKIMRSEQIKQNEKQSYKKSSKFMSRFQGQGSSERDKEKSPYRTTNDGKGDKYSNYRYLILSVMIFCSMQVLVVPTFTLFSNIINCNKLERMSRFVDSSGQIVQNFECLNLDHIILIAVSSVLTILFLTFIYIETILFQDINMKSSLPWRQMPSRIHQIKTFKKILVCLFNFELLTDSPIAIGIFTCYQSGVMYERYHYTRIYDRGMRWKTFFCEFSLLWFVFWNFISQVAQFRFNWFTFTILLLAGAIPYYLMVFQIYTGWRIHRLFMTERQSLKDLGSDEVAETYFGYLIDLIKSYERSEEDKLTLYGLIRTHWYNCKNKKNGATGEKCLCGILIQRINKIERIIDYDIQSRNDQFDIIKIQKQIGSIEEQIQKEIIKEKQQLIQKNEYAKKSINIDSLLNEIRLQDQAARVGTPGFKPTPRDQSVSGWGSGKINQNPSKFNFQQQMTFKGGNQIHSQESGQNEIGLYEQLHHASSQFNVQDSAQEEEDKDNEINQHLNNAAKIRTYDDQAQAIIQSLGGDSMEERDDDIDIRLNQSELRKEIRYLLFRYVYNQIDEANKIFPFSFRLKYLAAYIQYYLLRNEIKGLFEILMIERKNKIPLDWQFFLFKVKIEIEDYMEQVHKQRSTTSQRIDVKKVYLFSRQLQQFESGIEIISDKCLDFWKELLKKADFDANNLHKVGTEITLMNMELNNLVLSMFNFNPNHGYLLRIYALFTQKVMNNDEESEKYFKKFLNAQKTFSSYEAATLQEELVKNFSSNVKYVVIVMRVSTNETAIVEDVNHEIRNVLGYKRSDVIGRNLQLLMPRCVGLLHDQFVQNYLDTAKPKILNKQREVFALKKSGFIVQVFIYATTVPMIEKEGIKFVGFLKKVDEKKYTDILPPPIEYQFKRSIQIMAAPNGNIYGVNEQAYKVLGFPKYFVEESDDKHSDYNMSQIVVDYNKVLFDCFKTAPVGRKAYLDTENLKPFIVPDMHSQNDIRHIAGCFGQFEVYIQACPLDFGFKGGAYLPMIIFRLYMIERVSKKAIEKLKSPARKGVSSIFKQRSSFSRQSTNNLPKLKNSQERRLADRVTVQRFEFNGAIKEEESNQTSNDEDGPNKDKNSKLAVNEPTKSQQIQNFLESSQSSISQSNEGNSTDMARLREFRKMVNSRREPLAVIMLRRFVLVVTAVILALVSLNTSIKINFYNGFQNLQNATTLIQDIILELYEIHTGFHSINWMQNGFQSSEIIGLVSETDLQQSLISQLRYYLDDLNEDKNEFFELNYLLTPDVKDRLSKIELTQVNDDSSYSYETVNLNLALAQVVSKGNELIASLESSSKPFQGKPLISYINQVLINPKKSNVTTYNYTYGFLGNKIDSVTKSLYFVTTNTFYNLISVGELVSSDLDDLMDTYISKNEASFLVIIAVILTISVVSISLIFYFVRQIHQTRIQSLSLYAELNIDDIGEIITDLVLFMRIIKENSDDLNSKIYQYKEETSSEDRYEEEQFDDGYDDGSQDTQNRRNQLVDEELAGVNYKTEEGRIISEAFNKKKRKLDALKSGELKNLFIFKQQTLRPIQRNSEMDSMKSSDFDRESHYASSKQLPVSVNDINFKEPGTPLGNSHSPHDGNNEYHRKKSSFQHAQEGSSYIEEGGNYATRSVEIVDSLSGDNNNLSSSRDLNESHLSQRDLKLSMSQNDLEMRLERKKREKEKSDQLELEEQAKKVGNLDKFKMVKSNSNVKVISIVLLLFSFIIATVILNFAIFVPMFKSLKDSHHDMIEIISSYQLYYRIFSQMTDDLGKGSIEKSQDTTFKSAYDEFMQEKYDNQLEIAQIIQALDSKSSYLQEPIKLLAKLNTADYCETLQSLYKQGEGVSPFNMTFCSTVDNGVANKQGFRVQIERAMSQLITLRIQFEQKLQNPNGMVSIMSANYTLTRFVLMMNKMFSPTFYVVKDSITQNFKKFVTLNTNIDISILAVFIGAQLLILIIAWPKFLRGMNNQISQSRGILTLIPSRLIIANNNIRKIIEENKLLTQ